MELPSHVRTWQNVLILAFCQAIGLSGFTLTTLVGGIIGSRLAPSPAWSTLPIASMVVGSAIFTLPAAMAMKRVGRKRGFVAASAVASVAVLGAAFSISAQNFFFFCMALLVLGSTTAFVQQYRFAAAESVEPRDAGKTVSLVLIGGIFAGFLGPQVGSVARDWLGFGAYAGSFAAMAILYAASAAMLLFTRDIRPAPEGGERPERPLRTLVTQRSYLVAAISGATAFGVMGLIMSAASVSMNVMDGFTFSETVVAIQAHVVAMFLPSLFTGFLVDRVGIKALQIIGIASMGASVVIGASGHHSANYTAALVLLGLGWNFLFLGGTVLLTRSYYPSERFKAQGFNDLLIFAVQALATLSAGTVLATTSWKFLNLLAAPFLALTLVVVLVSRTARPASDSS